MSERQCRDRQISVSGQQATAVEADGKKYILLLIAQIVFILVVLTALTGYINKGIYVTVAITALAIPLLFAQIAGKLPVYRQRMADYFSHTLPGMSSEFMLFLSIGFFGYALAQSPVLAVVQAQLTILSDYSPACRTLLIIAAIAGLSIVGIHPIVTISSLAIALGRMDIGLSNAQLAITLITGYIMYLLLSPFSSMVMVLSGLSGKSVYAVGLRLNWRYAVVLALAATLVIQGWRLV